MSDQIPPTPKRLEILLVEDNPADADFLRELLREVRPTARVIGTVRLVDALVSLSSRHFDLVLLDLSLPDAAALEGVNRLRASFPSVPVVVLTSTINDSLAMGAVAAGAQDYLAKGELEAHDLIRTISYAIERQQFASRLHALAVERATAAEQASREKDDFLAVVSHELRTPLSAILGWTQLLQSDSVTPERRQQGLSTIERNARAQAKLIDDILDVSRMITGKLQIASARVELRPVVERALELARREAASRGVQLVIDLGLNLPAVQGDVERLVQVCSNLLSNAIKFTPKNGIVGVTLRPSGPNLELEIADTGIGIQAELLPRIFERFRQVDSTSSRAHAGLGLGLSIVHHVVELHGGHVEARSAGLGKGATFIVQLPGIGGAIGQPVPRSEVARALKAARTDISGKSVLIVEDDTDTREMLVAVLERSRVRVLTAGSADVALMVLDRERPDVLLLDLGLPGKDGVALISEIRKRPADQGGQIPAIAMTAFGGIEIRRRALAAGFELFWNKPIEAGALMGAIAELADGAARLSRP